VKGEKSLFTITMGALVIIGIFLSGCSQADDTCLGTEPHPIAVNIAANYDVDYAQVMDWYCNGYGFDDIILALETTSITPELMVEDLLQLIEEGKSWDEIWNDIGLMSSSLYLVNNFC
jgi:hypothetical protein